MYGPGYSFSVLSAELADLHLEFRISFYQQEKYDTRNKNDKTDKRNLSLCINLTTERFYLPDSDYWHG